MTSEATDIESIQLSESETVVGRGHRKVYWRIQLRDAWVSATQWPDARVERVDSRPGTVWERRIELRVPRGTRLERVDSQPAADRRRTPLAHLARSSPSAARQVRRTRYRVGPRGRLVVDRRETK